MESIRVRQHIGSDGILHLAIPIGMREQDIEIMVIYHPTRSQTNKTSLADLYGICQDDPIVLDDIRDRITFPNPS
ncbi:MAG: hypothetical protein AAGA60_32165 [Cyanobacteria bacterium P01_E01_bin.42]